MNVKLLKRARKVSGITKGNNGVYYVTHYNSVSPDVYKFTNKDEALNKYRELILKRARKIGFKSDIIK